MATSSSSSSSEDDTTSEEEKKDAESEQEEEAILEGPGAPPVKGATGGGGGGVREAPPPPRRGGGRRPGRRGGDKDVEEKAEEALKPGKRKARRRRFVEEEAGEGKEGKVSKGPTRERRRSAVGQAPGSGNKRARVAQKDEKDDIVPSQESDAAFVVTLQALQGRWRHSIDNYGVFSVRNDTVEFDHGRVPIKTRADGTLDIAGWVPVHETSNAKKICWRTASGLGCTWTWEEGALELDLKALQGRWRHSSPFLGLFSVQGSEVQFGNGKKLAIKVHGDGTLEVAGYTPLRSKCTAEKIVWCKPGGGVCSWSLEDDADRADDDEIDPATIVEGKRERKPVDYKALERQLQSEAKGAKGLLKGGRSDDSGSLTLETKREARPRLGRKRSSCCSDESSSSQAREAPPSRPRLGGGCGAGEPVRQLSPMEVAQDARDRLQAPDVKAEEAEELLRELARLRVDGYILFETKIGKVVNDVRKTFKSNAEIDKLAKDMLLRWKKIYADHVKKTAPASVPATAGAP